MTPPRLPDFLIIGAQKSGTSWLHHQLRQHPEIFMPERKELHYFSSDGEVKFAGANSLAWYESFFTEAPEKQRAGEATPSYLFRPDAATNIHATVPGAKLIASLRHPANRAYSQWRIQRKRSRVPLDLSFPEAFFSDAPAQAQLRDRGLYDVQLQRFFELFPREQVKIVFYDDLEADHAATLRSIHEFLEVDSAFLSESASHRLLPRVPFNDSVPTSMPDEYRDEIRRFYLPSIESLEGLLDVDLTHWKTC